MSKPTIFFSHSSKDKDVISAIKNKVVQYTGNTIEIFQSSDGESIPFGTNWIHKVEEGLENAKIMFVFVTENSISSGWIYFEAGYAYSKGIHVIPVGLGISIGDLKAPLNLLQGYNITSADSLNNFLTIINREFEYNFAAQFTSVDYDEIVSLTSGFDMRACQFDKIVRSVKYSLSGVYYDAPGRKYTRDTKSIFDAIKTYLDEHSFNYSLAKTNRYGYERGSCIAVQGIKITYEPSDNSVDPGDIYVSISPYNFESSFELYLKLIQECMHIENSWIRLRLNENYTYKTSAEDCAALLMKYPEWFSLSESRVGNFISDKLSLNFGIYNEGDLRIPDYVLGIGYEISNIKVSNIIELVSKLYELQIIQEIGG